MRNILKILKFKTIAFVVLITLIPCYKILANENNFSVNGIDYGISSGEMEFYGNWYGNNANNIDLTLEGSNIEIYLEMFVPNNSDRLVAGTYNLVESDNPMPFTYFSGDMAVNDKDFFYIVHGTVVVSVAGSGNNAVYTITLDCTLTDENGDIAGTIKGTYRGTLTWND